MWLKFAGTLGLLGVSIGFQGIYNLLIAYGSWVQYIAYLLPTALIVLGLGAGKLLPCLKIKS